MAEAAAVLGMKSTLDPALTTSAFYSSLSTLSYLLYTLTPVLYCRNSLPFLVFTSPTLGHTAPHPSLPSMAEFAELAMEGVPVITDHYEKVYDPLKEKTKQGISKVKEMREQRKSGGGGYESEYSSDEYYDGPPPRRSTTGGRRRSPQDDGRRRSGRDRGDFVTEERYAYRGPARAKSAGRDGPYREYGRDRRSKGETHSTLSQPTRQRC